MQNYLKKLARHPSGPADLEWAILEPPVQCLNGKRKEIFFCFSLLPASRDSFSFLMEEVAWASIALILLIALTWKMVHWLKISSPIIRMPEQSLSVICTKIININDKSCILHHCKNAYKTNKICKLNLNFLSSDFIMIITLFFGKNISRTLMILKSYECRQKCNVCLASYLI